MLYVDVRCIVLSVCVWHWHRFNVQPADIKVSTSMQNRAAQVYPRQRIGDESGSSVYKQARRVLVEC